MSKILSELQASLDSFKYNSISTDHSSILIPSDRLVVINSSEVIGCLAISVYLGKVAIGYWHGRASVICVFQKWLESKPKPRTSRQVIHNNPNGTRDKYICSFDKNKQILLHHRTSRENTGAFYDATAFHLTGIKPDEWKEIVQYARLSSAVNAKLAAISHKDMSKKLKLATPLASPFPDEELLAIDYVCPKCEHEWQEEWTCACDSECPKCGLENIQATDYEPV